MTQTVTDKFASAARAAEDASPSYLAEKRRQAYADFAERGFPTTRDEDWKYTDPKRIAEGNFRLPSEVPPPLEFARIPNLGGPFLLFANGRFVAQASSIGGLPEGAFAGSLAEAIRREDETVKLHLGSIDPSISSFISLNTALFSDGFFLCLPKDARLERPIELLHANVAEDGAPVAAHPRHLIVLEEGAEATVVERHVGGADGCFTNVVVESKVGKGARLIHVKIQDEDESAFHVAAHQNRQARDSFYAHFSISLGALFARNDLGTRLDDENCEAHMNGIYLVDGKRHVDHHTVIDHAKPHCRSDELYKGLLDGHGRGVFNGKIFVRRDAQKTDAIQNNKAVLLSPNARVDTKPQLEIFADDVRCTHGATVGQLDDEAMFYLRARGMPERVARRVLNYAFVRDVLDRLEDEALRKYCDDVVIGRMKRLGASG